MIIGQITSFFVNNYINVLHQNIAGLLTKSDTLTVCLEEFLKENLNIDVICVSEHFVMSGYEQYVSIPNYTLATSFCRNDSKRGGTCILVNNKHEWKEIPDITNLSISHVIECCAIELVKYKTIIVCMYRVPTCKHFDIFFDRLCKVIKISKNKKLIICGDFNIDLLKVTTQSSKFKDICLNDNVTIEIKQPTRLASQSRIDNILHNVQGCKSSVVELALSDHTAQILQYPVERVYYIDHWYEYKRDYSEENIRKFIENVTQLSFKEIFDSNDVNEAYNKFHEIFTLFYNLCFPLIKIKISKTKRPKWVSKGIKTCYRRKRF